MNINALRDADNDAGFYAAACGATGSTWRGAVIHRSVDGGGTYSAVGTVSVASTIGTVLGVLGNFTGGNIPDELNSFTVLLGEGAALSSTTYDGLIAGTQAALVGDEILYFRTATLNANGTYTVSGLLRGRRGSEYAMATHEASERFVLLSTDTLVRMASDTADIGLQRLYKAVTYGMDLASATAKAFTNEGAGLKPYACVQLGGGRNAAGDATLTWVRRSRISGEWRNGVDVPLGEASEAYEVEIWNSGFTTLKRTFTGLTAPTATYTAAEQTTDFGSPQATVYFRVYQLSAVVGRGYAASGSV